MTEQGHCISQPTARLSLTGTSVAGSNVRGNKFPVFFFFFLHSLHLELVSR